MKLTANDWQVRGETGMTDAQRRMLNAVAGDLARSIRWHGFRLDKDDFRHLLAGTMLGWRMMPAIDRGDGKVGFIMLGGSSLKLSKSQAADAITQGLAIGDDPSSQGIDAQPVRWSDAVLLGLGFDPAEMAA